MKLTKHKLGELLDVTRGTSLSGEYFATQGDYMRLTCGNFDYQNNCFKSNTSKDNLYYIGNFNQEYLMEKDDIITPLTEQAVGLLGSTAWVPESGKYIQSQDVAKITPYEKLLDKKFCYYLISSKVVKQQLSAAAQQTKIRHTSPDKIKDCTVWIPSLEEQTKIGQFLYDIDSKITLNRQINDNLEAMARQLYDYWFVQFDFPDEKGKPYKSSGGKMVWNEKLKTSIPYNWQVLPLDKIGKFKNGINYTKGEEGNKLYKIVNVRNISSSSFFVDNSDLDVLSLNSQNGDNYLVNPSNILIARSGTPGATRLLRTNERNVIYCGFIICYALNDVTFKNYMFFTIKKLEQVTKSQSNGSILNNISQDILKRLWITLPPCGLNGKFNDSIMPLFTSIRKNQEEIEVLTKQRDELLPLLMNGQATVNYHLSAC